MYQRVLSYYSTARNFIGKAAATGRHFLSHMDTALHNGFAVAQAARPIVAEAANLYGGQRAKQLLNRAAEGVDAAQAPAGCARRGRRTPWRSACTAQWAGEEK